MPQKVILFDLTFLSIACICFNPSSVQSIEPESLPLNDKSTAKVHCPPGNGARRVLQLPLKDLNHNVQKGDRIYENFWKPLNKKFLVVAVTDYVHFPKLRDNRTDAEYMSGLLRKHNYCGDSLVGNISLDQFESKIESLNSADLGENSVLIIYFTGHGGVYTEQNKQAKSFRLLFTDSKKESKGITVPYVINLLRRKSEECRLEGFKGKLIFLVDACYSGEIVGELFPDTRKNNFVIVSSQREETSGFLKIHGNSAQEPNCKLSVFTYRFYNAVLSWGSYRKDGILLWSDILRELVDSSGDYEQEIDMEFGMEIFWMVAFYNSSKWTKGLKSATRSRNRVLKNLPSAIVEVKQVTSGVKAKKPTVEVVELLFRDRVFHRHSFKDSSEFAVKLPIFTWGADIKVRYLDGKMKIVGEVKLNWLNGDLKNDEKNNLRFVRKLFANNNFKFKTFVKATEDCFDYRSDLFSDEIAPFPIPIPIIKKKRLDKEAVGRKRAESLDKLSEASPITYQENVSFDSGRHKQILEVNANRTVTKAGCSVSVDRPYFETAAKLGLSE